MSVVTDAWEWLASSSSWTQHDGIVERLTQHLSITATVIGIAAAVSLPLGILIGHRGRGGRVVLATSGAARAVPTLGLLTILGLQLGIGLTAPILALVVLAAPSILAGAYAGVASVDPDLGGAARAFGMSETQVIAQVELPLASPVILGGLRSATLQVVATATLAAYTADAGLGRYIFAGLKSRDYAEMTAGAVLVVALALLIDGLFALAQAAVIRRLALHPTERHP